MAAWWGSTVGEAAAPLGPNVITGMQGNGQPIMFGWLPWAAAALKARGSIGPWAMFSKKLSDAEIIGLAVNTGLPSFTVVGVTMNESATKDIAFDSLAPNYVGRGPASASWNITGKTAGLTSVTQQANRDIRIVAAAGSAGAQSFNLQLTDANGASTVKNIAVTVQAVIVGDDLGDPYGVIAKTVANVVMALRLGQPTGATQATDSSGNNRHGAYVAGGTGGLGSLAFSSPKDAYRTNGATGGYVTKAHDPAFELAAGAFAMWCMPTSLANQITLANKGANFQILIQTNGAVQLTWRGQIIKTPVGYAETGTRIHVMVCWDAADVRFYVDGFLVGGNENGQGLTGNTVGWVFGRSTAAVTSTITMGEIFLFGTAKKTKSHAAMMAEGQRGLGYRAALPGKTVNVGTTAAFNTALLAATPGTHIVVDAGVLITNPRAFDRTGTNENQIVIRAGGTNCRFAGPINISGAWQVIDGFTFDQGNDPIQLSGNRNRITRCTRTRFTSDCLQVNNGRFHRIDHSSFTRPSRAPATKGGCAPIEVNPHLNPPTKFCLIDHMYISSLDQVAGENGRDGIRVGSTAKVTAFQSYTMIYRCLFEDYNIDEIVSGKSSDIFIWYTTFTNTQNGKYAQNRHGRRGEWRSCYFLNTELRFLGADHIAIGCTFNSNLVRFSSGFLTQQQWEDYAGDENDRPTRPNCENVGLLQNTFTNGAQVNSLDGKGPLKAKDCYMRGNTGETINVSTAFYTPMPLTDGASQGEWYELGTQLGPGAVGTGGGDELVQNAATGLK